MPGLLVYVHHDDGQFAANSLGVLAKAAGIGGEVTAFVAGAGIDDGWAGSLGGHGAARVLVADDPALAGGLSQPIVDALEPSAREADAVLFSATARVGRRRRRAGGPARAGIACETTDLASADGGIVATRPALDDTVMVESGFASKPGVVLARANAFAPREDAAGSAPVERVAVTVSDWSKAAALTGREAAESGGVDITEADILVTVGRGMGGPENVPLVEALAKALGGEVAATRAVVDAGWVPYSMQVGQTGKTVSPKLYIACGVSGAIQHKVGMANAGRDHRDQQGSERAHLRVRRRRRGRRRARDPAEADRARRRPQGLILSGAVPEHDERVSQPHDLGQDIAQPLLHRRPGPPGPAGAAAERCPRRGGAAANALVVLRDSP